MGKEMKQVVRKVEKRTRKQMTETRWEEMTKEEIKKKESRREEIKEGETGRSKKRERWQEEQKGKD